MQETLDAVIGEHQLEAIKNTKIFTFFLLFVT